MRRLLVLMALGSHALPGCGSSPIAAYEPSITEQVARRKQRMLVATDLAIQRLLADATSEGRAVRRDFDNKLAGIATGPALAVVDPVLESFGEAERAEFRAKVEELELETCTHLEGILATLEARLWAVAEEAGKVEGARSVEYRSGYRELDEKVDTTMLQVSRRADLDDIRQQATLRAFDRLLLNRVLKEEIEGLGLLQVFQTADEVVPREYRSSDMALCFTLKRAEGVTAPLHFEQAINRRMERDGIVIREQPWEWDPALGLAGRLPSRAEITDPGYVVTDFVTPGINIEGPGIENFLDRELLAEYRTALVESDSGNELLAIAWQVTWSVDYLGNVRSLVGECRLIEDDVLAQLRAQSVPPPPQAVAPPEPAAPTPRPAEVFEDGWLEEFADS